MRLPLDLERTIAFIEKCGLHYAVGSECEKALQWQADGVLRAPLNADAPANLCHELAHLLIASPAHARLVEFGLGVSPDGGNGERAAHVAGQAATHDVDRSDEETRASMLGILIERALRLRSWPRTYRLHGWDGRDSLENRQRVLRWLENEGLAERYRSHSSAHPLDCWRARVDVVRERAAALRPLFADPISAPELRSARVPSRTSDSAPSHPPLA